MANLDVVGRCGIYCGACPIYRGTRGDKQAHAFARDVWKTPINRMTCDGCHNLKPESHGIDCPRRECMNKKDLEYCSECTQYDDRTCKKFEEFERYFNKRGESLRDNLSRIRSGDVDAWLEKQVAKWSCRYCGVPTFWEEKKCPSCGKPLK
jgi:rubrerythrin